MTTSVDWYYLEKSDGLFKIAAAHGTKDVVAVLIYDKTRKRFEAIYNTQEEREITCDIYEHYIQGDIPDNTTEPKAVSDHENGEFSAEVTRGFVWAI